MSYEIVLMFAPCESVARWDDPEWRPDRTLYRDLKLLPTVVPLCVDHDPDWQIGRVNTLFKLNWIDGRWWAATATLDDAPPTWMRRHTPVSFGSFPGLTREVHIDGVTREVVTSCLVKEISVLLAKRPAEPNAAVMSIRRSEGWPAAVASSNPTAVGEVVHTPHSGVLIRPGIGQILAVDGVPLR